MVTKKLMWCNIAPNSRQFLNLGPMKILTCNYNKKENIEIQIKRKIVK